TKDGPRYLSISSCSEPALATLARPGFTGAVVATAGPQPARVKSVTLEAALAVKTLHWYRIRRV
ncbi:MAG: hypothetical protein ACYDD0_06690, partial [Candidatus Dormibacteria bacterium]